MTASDLRASSRVSRVKPPPRVSIIVPCLDERKTIVGLLQAISDQTYPVECLEVVVADGMSTDGTRELVDSYRADNPDLRIRLVDNPERVIPTALNRALAAAGADILLRLDAHAAPAKDFVERSVGALQSGAGDCVGGLIKVEPSSDRWLSRCIAAAVSHPVGVGDARHRYSTRPGPVDSVPFVCFRRDLIARIGGFDARLHANQDFDFNFRVRRAGGTVWFDPTIRAVYYSRPSLRALGRQYRRYGAWKVRMLGQTGDVRALRPRQLAPPSLVIGLGAAAVASPMSRRAQKVFAGQALIYALLLAAAGYDAARRRNDIRLAVGVSAAMAVIHVNWGAGFLRELLQPLMRKR